MLAAPGAKLSRVAVDPESTRSVTVGSQLPKEAAPSVLPGLRRTADSTQAQPVVDYLIRDLPDKNSVRTEHMNYSVRVLYALRSSSSIPTDEAPPNEGIPQWLQSRYRYGLVV